MFRNLGHALRWSYETAERSTIGYSNTAAIMRLGEQCGASASTSPDDLSAQEKLAQAVWVIQTVEAILIHHPLELAAIQCEYGRGSTDFADGLITLATQFDHVCMNILIVDDLLASLYCKGDKQYKMMRLADKHDKERKVLYRYRDKIEKQCREWQYSAEEKLEQELRAKKLFWREKIAA